MGRVKLKRWLLALPVMLVGLLASAATETITFSSQGWENAQDLTSETVTGTNVTVSFATNVKYYTSGAAARVYGGGSVTLTSSSKNITAITYTFTTGDSYYPSSGDVVDTGALTMNSNVGTWSGKATSVTITRASGSGHWRLVSVEVTVEDDGGNTGGGGDEGGDDPVETTAKTYKRINSVSDITADGKYIIVTTAGPGAMGGIKATNYRDVISDGVTINDDVVTVTSSDVSVFTITSASSGYTIYDGTYYLGLSSNATRLNSLTSATGTTAMWTISFSDNDVKIVNVAYTSKQISYYAYYSEFNTYSSSSGIQLFKEYTVVAGDPEVPTLTGDFSFWPTENETASASATITPASGNTVYYTTDGSEPSNTNGTKITATTVISFSSTTVVKAISYLGDKSSEVVTRTYSLGETVTGIGEFRNLSNGTTVRLYLPDSYNARVLFVNNKEAFIRDNSGAMCIYGLSANPSLKYNQHLAGWIVGTYTDYNGLPEFTVVTGKTNTNFLAIAEPVTEEDVNPVEILASDYDSYLADWVTVKDLRVSQPSSDLVATAESTDLVVYNRFSLGTEQQYAAPYVGALVDLSGIAIPYGSKLQLAPISQNDVTPIVYVLDESQDFTSPSADLSPVTVRLNRTLRADRWNALTLPISITDFDGTILEYTSVANAGTAHVDGDEVTLANFELEEVTTTDAGVPYLVKPNSDLVNPVFIGATLSSAEAQTVSFSMSSGNGARRRTASDGTYSLVGVYNPTTLETGSTVHVLDDNSIAQWATSTSNEVQGTSAYFATPENTVVQLKIGDNIITGIDEVKIDFGIDDDDAEIYNILGVKMNRPLRDLPQGVYIVNGIKVVK